MGHNKEPGTWRRPCTWEEGGGDFAEYPGMGQKRRAPELRVRGGSARRAGNGGSLKRGLEVGFKKGEGKMDLDRPRGGRGHSMCGRRINKHLKVESKCVQGTAFWPERVCLGRMMSRELKVFRDRENLRGRLIAAP